MIIGSLLTFSKFPPPVGGGHVKKDYAVLPKRILEEPAHLKKLVDASIRFAS